MRFLVNRPKRKGLSRAKARKILHDKTVRGRPLTAKQRKFFGARAQGAPTPRRRTRARRRSSVRGAVTGEGSMARKRKRARRHSRRTVSRSHRRSTARRRRRVTVSVNPRRRSRRVRRSHGRKRAHRSHRVYRNPRFSMGGIKSMFVEGVKDAGAIILGRAGTKLVRKLIPIPQDTMVKQLGVGVGASFVTGYLLGMVSPRLGRLAFAAGLADTVTPALSGLPVVGPYLGDPFLGDSFLNAYPQAKGVGAYPQGMGAIPMTTGASVMSEDGIY